MGLAGTFLDLVRRASLDVDLARLREETALFSARHAGLSTRHKGELLVRSVARRAAALGAAASLPAGWAAVAAAAPELSALLLLQSRMILGLHLLYGHEPEPEERAAEVLASLAAGTGLNVGRRLTTRALEDVAARRHEREARRAALHGVTQGGAAIGAAMYYPAVQALGRAVLSRVEGRYGPPEIPGRGGLIEGTGRIT